MYSSFVLFALLKKQQANASSRQEQDTSVGASLACVGAAVLVSRLVGWLVITSQVSSPFSNVKGIPMIDDGVWL